MNAEPLVEEVPALLFRISPAKLAVRCVSPPTAESRQTINRVKVAFRHHENGKRRFITSIDSSNPGRKSKL